MTGATLATVGGASIAAGVVGRTIPGSPGKDYKNLIKLLGKKNK